MRRPPPRSTLTDSLFPYTALFLSPRLRANIGAQMPAVGFQPCVELLLLGAFYLALGRPYRPGCRLRVDINPISRTCAHAVFHPGHRPVPASFRRKPVGAPLRDASRPCSDRKSTRLNSSH